MFKNAVSLFQFSGFNIRIDPSWLLIAALIIWSLSSWYFPIQIPGQTLFTYVVLSVVAMLGLYASLLLHELSHSFMARKFGLNVHNITLFIFGGVAELESEPKSPKAEFWIAIVGPFTSLMLAAAFSLPNLVFGQSDSATPFLVITNYLVLINFVIAVFNMLPAFPLDGGRVFRALLWHIKKDLLSATKLASAVGNAFGFLLIVAGVLSIFSTSSLGGLWQILIGFFIVQASRSSYEQLQVEATLKGLTAGSLMSRDVVTAQISDTIRTLVDDVILHKNITFVPVLEGEELIGYVTAGLVQKIDQEHWDATRLSDIYVAADALNTIPPDTAAPQLLKDMVKNNQRKYLVADGDSLLGVISLTDLMAYLAVRKTLNLEAPASKKSEPRKATKEVFS
ncbi:site-2 protease family protein [Pseudahrensia aquimaris]|uniref:Zinc metalloprotease n=1 Tax=Pseudahrensia aquimaris TaxID=744461 RepID=A0ABW3F8N3_9HYPH